MERKNEKERGHAQLCLNQVLSLQLCLNHYGDPALFFARKLTDLYCGLMVSTENSRSDYRIEFVLRTQLFEASKCVS